jgi:2-dehydropantoate 2-reductase
VTLQNGLGNREALQLALGDRAVAVGVTTAGATLLEPGHVLGHPGKTVLAGSPGQRHAIFVELFQGAGLEAELSPDIEPLVWRKLVANCAINPLSALLGVTNGALLDAVESRQILERAAREAGAVAAALGIDLGEDPASIATDVARWTAGNRSSMLQDLGRGARTEIDAITGAVVREARRLGVPVPVNEELYADIRRREGRSVSLVAET